MATDTQKTVNKPNHGAFCVPRHENQSDFDALLARLRDDFRPADEHESFLIEQMAHSRWRLARAHRLETAILDQMLEGELSSGDPDQCIANKLLTGGDHALSAIQRYAAAAERSYYKAHAGLLRSRQMRNEAKTAEHLDAAVLGRIIEAPPVRNEPKSAHSPLVTRHPPLPALKL